MQNASNNMDTIDILEMALNQTAKKGDSYMSDKLHDIRELNYGCEIIFACGKTTFLQGDDASSLMDEIEKCETELQIHNILDEYSVLIEE